MKIGFESRIRTVAAYTLLSLALLVLGRFMPFFEMPSFMAQSTAINESAANRTSKDKMRDDSTPLDPTLHGARLESAESRRYEGSGRNIFRSAPELLTIETVPPLLPNPPGPSRLAVRPQIPLRFFGFVSMREAPRKGFFGDADAVFVASEGEVIDRRYRIVRIEANHVEVEDLIEHTKHTLSLPG